MPPSDERAALEAAREYVEDACAFYPHGDGPPITFSNEERIRVLVALILRQRAEAVEAARPEIERAAKLKALSDLTAQEEWVIGYGIYKEDIEAEIAKLEAANAKTD